MGGHGKFYLVSNQMAKLMKPIRNSIRESIGKMPPLIRAPLQIDLYYEFFKAIPHYEFTTKIKYSLLDYAKRIRTR